MEVTGIRSAQDISLPGADRGGSDELGKNEFLELMIAQMNNQDPLDPAKNEDFIAQLAQFSTVEGIENMNGSMAGMAAALQSSLTVQASSLVGRSVLAPTSQTVMGGAGLVGSIDLPETSGGVVLEISSGAGELVRRLELGAQAAGTLRFSWDGTTSSGQNAPQGIYRVHAFSEVGNSRKELTVSMPEQVVSVSLGDDGVVANLAGGTSVPATQIKEIQ